MKKQHQKPCKACPWRKASAKGWLGDSTPVEFMQTSEAEHRMPCHLHVDYERPEWRSDAENAPQCVGRAVHFANRCKQPRNTDLLHMPADREQVFSNPQDFIDHHTLDGKPKTIRILGPIVFEVD